MALEVLPSPSKGVVSFATETLSLPDLCMPDWLQSATDISQLFFCAFFFLVHFFCFDLLVVTSKFGL